MGGYCITGLYIHAIHFVAVHIFSKDVWLCQYMPKESFFRKIQIIVVSWYVMAYNKCNIMYGGMINAGHIKKMSIV